MFCLKCNDGSFTSNTYDDVDLSHSCRNITIEELYQYFKDKYNEELTMDQIRKNILNI